MSHISFSRSPTNIFCHPIKIHALPHHQPSPATRRSSVCRVSERLTYPFSTFPSICSATLLIYMHFLTLSHRNEHSCVCRLSEYLAYREFTCAKSFFLDPVHTFCHPANMYAPPRPHTHTYNHTHTHTHTHLLEKLKVTPERDKESRDQRLEKLNVSNFSTR